MGKLVGALAIVLSGNFALAKGETFKSKSGKISFEVPDCYKRSRSEHFVNFVASERCEVPKSDFRFREGESSSPETRISYRLWAGAKTTPECASKAKAVQAAGGALECGVMRSGTEHRMIIQCDSFVGELTYTNEDTFKEQKALSELKPQQVRAVFESVRCNGKPIQLPVQKWSRGKGE